MEGLGMGNRNKGEDMKKLKEEIIKLKRKKGWLKENQ